MILKTREDRGCPIHVTIEVELIRSYASSVTIIREKSKVKDVSRRGVVVVGLKIWKLTKSM